MIVGAAKQVARDRGHELAVAIGKEMLSIVRARLGEDVGKALGDFMAALATQQEQSLLARLRVAEDSDLVNLLPDHVRVCAGHLTATAAQQDRIRLLRMAGARELPVTGLDEPAVKAWMAAKRLDTRMARRVQRLTGGYPLFIDDTLAVLAGGGTLRDIAASAMFASNTEDALHDLDLGTSRAARLLSAYADPPPRDRLLGRV